MNATRKFYYYAATPSGDLWELKPGHVFELEGKPWVCTGFEGNTGVWIAHENRIVLIRGSDLWDVLSVRNMSPRARDDWNAQKVGRP